MGFVVDIVSRYPYISDSVLRRVFNYAKASKKSAMQDKEGDKEISIAPFPNCTKESLCELIRS